MGESFLFMSYRNISIQGSVDLVIAWKIDDVLFIAFISFSAFQKLIESHIFACLHQIFRL